MAVRANPAEIKYLATGIANRLGLDPLDVATVMGYETGGTYDQWQAGPTTKWGRHRGRFQWGEPQRAKYGVYRGMPLDAEVEASVRYLQDAGIKPGMGLLDLYSAINAGHVGRPNASDRPGYTVARHVQEMGAHRALAAEMLGAPDTPLPPGQAILANAPRAGDNAGQGPTLANAAITPSTGARGTGTNFGAVLAQAMAPQQTAQAGSAIADVLKGVASAAAPSRIVTEGAPNGGSEPLPAADAARQKAMDLRSGRDFPIPVAPDLATSPQPLEMALAPADPAQAPGVFQRLLAQPRAARLGGGIRVRA